MQVVEIHGLFIMKNLVLKKYYNTFTDHLKLLVINIFNNTPKLFKKNYYFQNWIIDVLRPTILKFGQIIGGIKFMLK